MCLAASNVKAMAQWNWEGDAIVHDPIIRASRCVPATKTRYDIDIREYVSSRDNAVVRRAVNEMRARLALEDQRRFLSSDRGSFDFRVQVVSAYVADQIEYQPRRRRDFDAWLFPEETLAVKKGDCEDRAFLLASLLLAAGVSGYVVRVVFGRIYRPQTRKSKDHVWVMYENEDGVWMLLEPMLYTERARKQSSKIRGRRALSLGDTIEYVPYFMCNDAHLWRVRANTDELFSQRGFLGYLQAREFWADYDPEFAAGVHNSLFDDAFGSQLGWAELLYVKSVSVAMDINPAAYDPRDHFDNGYVPEAWERVDQRVGQGTLGALAQAGHACADFYAHTAYDGFAKQAGGKLVPYDWKHPGNCLARPLDYSAGPYALSRFSCNDNLWTQPTKDQGIAYWKGKIISGRFAQTGDKSQGALEKTIFSIPYALRTAPDFFYRACLPHHNEIAVDQSSGTNSVCADPAAFEASFNRRRDAALAHMKDLYSRWAAGRA